mmetsp:Transcript_34527/g.55999  ORF Transcript_34527/g.55999 Transcript_34527/m.55999 type:complete len:327 (+) Transcript_34527:87-1067(+)
MPRPSKGNRSNPWGSAVADFKNLRSNRSGLAMDVTGKGVKNSKSNTAAAKSKQGKDEGTSGRLVVRLPSTTVSKKTKLQLANNRRRISRLKATQNLNHGDRQRQQQQNQVVEKGGSRSTNERKTGSREKGGGGGDNGKNHSSVEDPPHHEEELSNSINIQARRVMERLRQEISIDHIDDATERTENIAQPLDAEGRTKNAVKTGKVVEPRVERYEPRSELHTTADKAETAGESQHKYGVVERAELERRKIEIRMEMDRKILEIAGEREMELKMCVEAQKRIFEKLKEMEKLYEESRENVDKVAKNYALAIELVRRNYNEKIAELEG